MERPPRDAGEQTTRAYAEELLRLAAREGRNFSGPWPHPRTLEAVEAIVAGGWAAFCALQERNAGRIAGIIGKLLEERDRKGWPKKKARKGAA